MKILQLCKKFPYPLKDGESIAVTYLSRALVEKGCELTLLAMNTTKHHTDVKSLPDDYDHYQEIHVTDLDNRLKPIDAFKNLFSKDSYHVSRFVCDHFEEKLIELLQKNDYDVVQLETLYLTPYVETIKKHSNAIVAMRAHNIEFEIWERITKNTNNPIKRSYLKHLTKKLKKYELGRLNDYDYLISVSPRDLKKFKELGYKNGAMSTPIGLELDNYIKVEKKTKPNSICFIGAMDWMPNREGLDWFLEQVWPELHRQNPELEFHIAGRNTPNDLLNLNLDNVTVHGEVPNAIDFINRYEVMVVPLFSGSGMRVKILEGMALNKAIVTTTLGMEGIGAKHNKELIIADTSEEFIDSVISIFSDDVNRQRIADQALAFVKEQYDHAQIAEKLIEKYEYLVANPY